MSKAPTATDPTRLAYDALLREHAELRAHYAVANARIAELTAEVGRLALAVAQYPPDGPHLPLPC